MSQARIAELEAERDALKAELANVLSDWNDLVRAIGSPTNGGAIGFARALRAECDALKAICARTTHVIDAIKRAGWVTSPTYLEEMSSLRADINAAKWKWT